MKVKIQNLGAVKAAEIELKPLTVFVGENGTGKTWSAYALASIFNRDMLDIYTQDLSNNSREDLFPVLDDLINSIINDQSPKFDIVEFVEKNLGEYLNDLGAFCPVWLGGILNTSKEVFKDVKFKFSPSENDIDFLVKALNSAYFEGSAPLSNNEADCKLLFSKKSSDDFILFHSKKPKYSFNKKSQIDIRQRVLDCILRLIHIGLFQDVFVLPTERSLFTSLFRLNDNNTEISASLNSSAQNRHFLTRSTVGQFVLQIRSFSKEEQAERIHALKNNQDIERIANLSKVLESEILLGSVGIDESNQNQLLVFKFEDDQSIELMGASSMVKELSSLVLYLRFFAKPYDLIVIDEPEMNLHPAAQVEIAEFLAMLVNAGLNLIITTHSPYIVDHLSNLMIAHGREDKAELTKKLYLENEDAFISPEKVSVYLFEDGTAKSILEDDGIIEWSTFSNVSDDIGNFL
ncbi:MAG: AAA family ATPase [Cyanobacteria bacterium P01_G01_bin.54]